MKICKSENARAPMKCERKGYSIKCERKLMRY